MNKDFYKVLGVSEDAPVDEIKKVYRRLAKKYHPDRNKGDASAEAKFKEVTEAYETLKDARKREEYDTMRKYGAFAGGAQAGPGHADFFANGGGGRVFRFEGNPGDFGDIQEMLGSLFGGGGFSRGSRRGAGAEDMFTGRRTQRGANVNITLSISFMEAVHGVQKTLHLRGETKKLKVRIPAGADDGARIRLGGQGQPGLYGGRNGDLIITVKVMTDQNFKRVGNDIHTELEISFIEAIKGCKKPVKTLTRTVNLTVPPGTQPGAKMRLKGMGLDVAGKTGDQYVEVKVTIPTTLTEKQKRLLDEWEG
jgi:DnaJ-class molecular chaperone